MNSAVWAGGAAEEVEDSIVIRTGGGILSTGFHEGLDDPKTI